MAGQEECDDGDGGNASDLSALQQTIEATVGSVCSELQEVLSRRAALQQQEQQQQKQKET